MKTADATDLSTPTSFALISAAQAATPHKVVLHGTFGLKPTRTQPIKPPSGKQKSAPRFSNGAKVAGNAVTNVNFGNGTQVDLSGVLNAADGADGYSDQLSNCDAVGGNGHDGTRISIVADDLTIGGLTVNLGNGGAGGAATTSFSCSQSVTARAGNGGKPGNLKIAVSDQLDIVGALDINPGFGGAGGSAFALAPDALNGCPAQVGYDASATAGNGADSSQKLDIVGSVTGGNNVSIAPLQIGGDAGWAYASGGNGGSGNKPGCAGAHGGNGSASGGNGGSGKNGGGSGGNVFAYGGSGGNGGACGTNQATGGDGGKGGNALGQPGFGGSGTMSLRRTAW